MDDTEIRRLMETMMDEMRTAGSVSSDTLRKFSDATSGATKGLDSFQKSASTSAKELGNFTKGLAHGNTNFEQFNSLIGRLSEGLAKALEGIPFAGGIAAGSLRAVGESAKFMMTQMDTVAKAYQELGSVAANTVDGITGLQSRFNQLGLVSLPTFTKSVVANNFALTAFRGNLGKGADDLADIFGQISTSSGDQFQRLGYTIDNVAESTANYIAAQSRYGFAQAKTNKQLTESALAYIKEQDVLTRLTGQAAKAQEDEQKKSLANVAFRATMAELEANGQEKVAKQLQLFINSLPPPLADAARGTLSGIPLTQAAQDAQILMGNVLGEALENIKQGSQATTEMGKVFDASSRSVQGWNRYLQVAPESFASLGTSIYDLDAINKRAIKEGKTREQVEREIRREQQALMNTIDPLTKDFVETQNALVMVSKDLQAFSFALLPYGVNAVNKFSDALLGSIEKMAEFAGIEIPSMPGRDSRKLAAAQAPTKSMTGAPLHVPGAAVGGEKNPVNIKIDENTGKKIMKDAYDFIAEKKALEMGLPESTIANERVKKMADFYRKEAIEELEKAKKDLQSAKGEKEKTNLQLKIIDIEKKLGRPSSIVEQQKPGTVAPGTERATQEQKPGTVAPGAERATQEQEAYIWKEVEFAKNDAENYKKYVDHKKQIFDNLITTIEKSGEKATVQQRSRAVLQAEKQAQRDFDKQARAAGAKQSMPAAPTGAPGTRSTGNAQDPLAGLNVKSRAEMLGGGPLDPRILDLARKIQEIYPSASFTAGNDRYHLATNPNSKHTQGKALDFTLDPAPRDMNESALIKQAIKSLGFTDVKDEYFADRNRFTRGGHIHAELARGGITTGPSIAGEDGAEAVIPLPGNRKIPVQFTSRAFDILTKSITQLNANFGILNKTLANEPLETENFNALAQALDKFATNDPTENLRSNFDLLTDKVNLMTENIKPKFDYASPTNSLELSQFNLQAVEQAINSMTQQTTQALKEVVEAIKDSARNNTSGLEPAVLDALMSIERNTNQTNSINSKILQVSRN